LKTLEVGMLKATQKHASTSSIKYAPAFESGKAERFRAARLLHFAGTRRHLSPSLALAGLLISACLLVACAPLPRHVYVPRAEGAAVDYSSCAFNSHVPVGLTLNSHGVGAHVKLAEHDGQRYIEMRLEVPEGKTLTLQSSRIAIRAINPPASFTAEFPTASLVDNPIVNATSSVPGMASYQLSPTAKLVGGRVQAGRNSSNRYFWFATYIGKTSAEEIVVTLPSFTINDIPYSLPPVHFTRQSMVVVALFNC
jgi:hypothetical protein